MIRNIAVVLSAIAIATLGYLVYNRSAVDPFPETTVEGTPVTFTLADLDGNLRQFSEWDGKARLVNFWATWCAPCRREIPLLKKTQEEHADIDLQVIGVAVDFIEDVSAYAEEAQFNYPVLIGQEDAMAVVEASGTDFVGLPYTMIVAPDGKLIKTHIGELHEDQIELIVEVFEQMHGGEIDVAGARSALKSF